MYFLHMTIDAWKELNTEKEYIIHPIINVTHLKCLMCRVASE